MAEHPKFIFRLTIKAGVAMGPGKADLLRAIEATGSITAAAKQLGMSYRTAWLLVQSMNQHFTEPLVIAGRGGATRGGATVTPTGHKVVVIYEKVQAEAAKAAAKHSAAFSKFLKTGV